MNFIRFFLMAGMVGAAYAQPLDSVVAVVNDQVITETELNRQVDALKTELDAKRSPIPEDSVLRKQVLQHLIDVDIDLQLAKKNDIALEKGEVDETIHRIADSNHMTIDELKDALAKRNMSWSTYKHNIYKEMLVGRVQQKAVAKDMMISKEQVESYMKEHQEDMKSHQTYHLQNIVIPLPEEPTVSELEAASNKAQSILKKVRGGADFSEMAIAESGGAFALEGGDLGLRHLAELPKLFADKVVTMHVGDVSEPIRTGNGYQLIKLVGISGESMDHEIHKTHVRHILLKPAVSMTAYEAQKQAENVYQQIKGGKDFGQMAMQYSLDSASALKGGDLGWVMPGDTVPDFEKAMDALPLHQVSRPVKTPFGWHIIEVLERKVVNDSDAFQRQQVRAFLQQRKFTEAVEQWHQKMRGEAYVQVVDKTLV